MRPAARAWRDRGDLHAALLTGGTGISPRDQTYETVSALLTKPLPGYGELFRMLSYAEIGPATILSRAVGRPDGATGGAGHAGLARGGRAGDGRRSSCRNCRTW